MPIRWVICPVKVYQDFDPETQTFGRPYRAAKVHEYFNKLTGNYSHSAAISDGQPGQPDFAVCFVRSENFLAMATDPEIIDVIQRDYDDGESFLARTPRLEAWTGTRRNRLLNLLSSRGVDTTGLTQDSPFWQFLERIMKHVRPGGGPLGTFVPARAQLLNQPQRRKPAREIPDDMILRADGEILASQDSD